MTGHWSMPAIIPEAFQSAKYMMKSESSLIAINSTIPKRTLVDVNEGLKGGNDTDELHSESNKTIDILWFNKPVWINLEYANHVLRTQCAYSNCHMTNKATNLQRFDGIVYCLTSPLMSEPPITKEERNPDQVWVYFGLESPINNNRFSYRHEKWRNTMNWSMTYEYDADIFFPYGMLQSRSKAMSKDYNALFRRKTKIAAWFVSNCGAPSGRDEYVSELERYGLEVDMFGRCHDDVFHERNELTQNVNDNYKFYLSFENSLCKDYITEKFFRYYNLNVVLVVRGGGDYDGLLPNGTFINSAHFETAKQLAEYLVKVGSSEKLYTSYLKRKDMFIAKELFTMPTSYCSLCHKLNHVDDYRKSYVDHVTKIHDNTCWSPSDIPITRTTYWTLIAVVIIFITCIFTVIFVKRNQIHSYFTQCVQRWS
ncbi:hypothetical protein ACF0H5_017604 [Mactra antiquata]